MLIRLFQITFFNQYLISPKTYLHKVPNEAKIFFIFCLLLIVPYISHIYVTYLIVIYLFIRFNLKVPPNYSLNLKYILILMTLYLSSSCLSISQLDTIISHKMTISNQHVAVTTAVTVKSINKDNYTIVINFLKYIDQLPNYVFRGILIYTIYLEFLKILYLTTSYENIIMNIFLLCTFFFGRITIRNIFVTTMGLQFLTLSANNISILIKAIVLRDCHCMYSYIYAVRYLYSRTYVSMKQLSLSLQYREISLKNFSSYYTNKSCY